MRLRHLLTMTSVAALAASTVVVGAATASAATTNVVVRPGDLHGWGVKFTTGSVRPGFVTGPPTVVGRGVVPVRHRRTGGRSRRRQGGAEQRGRSTTSRWPT